MNRIIAVCAAVLLAITLNSCKKDDDDTVTVTDQQKVDVLTNYAALVHASYEDALNETLDLQTAINAFVANPTAAGLTQCQEAWKAARIPYGQTETYRFYAGPIDDDNGPEGLINAWPMDESYIDYVSGSASSGIINDATTFPTITKQVLLDANENGGETNVATGYHAIEFLLWGQDLSASTAGQRPYTDYVTSGGTAMNQARRATYLTVATDLLIENLTFLVEEWKVGGTYRTNFVKSASLDQKLTNIFRGIGAMSKGELAGERIAVALTNQDQEDEHSCFSDNTHVDIQMNYKGIENVYLGTYKRVNGSTVSGTSLSDLVSEIDADKDAAVKAQLTATSTAVYAIPAPFDQAILTDPGGKVTNSINELRTLSDKLVDAAFALGLQPNFELD